MVLHVIRHGETDFNVQNRYAGSTDVPLNAVGIAQAKTIANTLAENDFDGIVSSPLIRAIQTAEIIAAHHPDTPIIAMDEFAERNLGVYEGLTRAEAQARYPELWARLSSWPLDDAPTGSETIRQFDTRIGIGIRKLKEQYADQTILLVCHGFTSRVINRQLTNISFEEMNHFTLGNCQIATYTI